MAIKSGPEAFYSAFTQSHEGVYSPELIKLISNAHVALLGLGFGAETLRQLVQSGYQHFIITDPDSVEIGNLQRQPYTLEQARTAVSKVTASITNAQAINPDVSINGYIDGTTPANAKEIVDKSDIVIDAMDPFDALGVAIQVQKLAAKQGKYVLYPIELGLRGVIYVFDPRGISLKQFFGLTGKIMAKPTESQYSQIAQTLLKDADPFAIQIANMYLHGELEKYPQNPFTTAAAAAGTGIIATRILGLQKFGKDPFPQMPHIRYAPEPNIINLFNPSP